MDATLTNTITDFMNALVLGMCFFSSLIHYLKKNPFFSLPIVLIFLSSCLLFVLGIISHASSETSVQVSSGILISLGVIYSNYLFIESLWFSQSTRLLIMLFSVGCTFAYITKGEYIYIALPFIMMYTLAAFSTRSLLRVGFFMMVASNIFWIVLRMIETQILGHSVPINYRYDNDIYHLLIMFSSFIIYRAAAKGYWQKPIEARPS